MITFILPFTSIILLFISDFQVYQVIPYGERFPAYAYAITDGRYFNHEERLLNPVYNPIPGDVILYVVLGAIFQARIYTSVKVSTIVIYLAEVTLAFSSILLFVNNAINRKDYVTCYAPVLFFAFTPVLLFTEHICKFIAMCFTLIILGFITKSQISAKTLILLTLLFAGGIVFHPTISAVIFIIPALLTLMILGYNISLKKYIFTLLIFVMIALAKLTFTYGTNIFVNIYYLIHAIKDYLLFHERPHTIEEALYARKHVPGWVAFSWTHILGMTIAYILLKLIVRRQQRVIGNVPHDMLPILTGMYVLFIGFLAYITKVGFHASLYNGFAMVLPVSVSLVHAVRSYVQNASRWRLILISMLLLKAFTLHALAYFNDPSVSFQGLNAIKGVTLNVRIISPVIAKFLYQYHYCNDINIVTYPTIAHHLVALNYLDHCKAVHVIGFSYNPEDPKAYVNELEKLATLMAREDNVLLVLRKQQTNYLIMRRLLPQNLNRIVDSTVFDAFIKP